MPVRLNPVDTRVIGGFLGAGKTTFILEQLKTAGAKVAVLVNEFGKLGIDGELIRLQGGVEVVELPGGCICCSQKQGLLESVRQIAGQISPELLLIEPSGVAEISEVLQVLSDSSLAGVIRVSTVITVIDAESFLEFSEPEAFGLFFLDQLRCADLILANKSDLVSPEVLKAIEERVALLNPGAILMQTEYCRLEGALPDRPDNPQAFCKGRPSLGIDSMSSTPGEPFSEEGFARLLTELDRGRFGRILRGKGFIQVADRGWLNLQIVSGQVTIVGLPAAVTPRLTLIGFELRPAELAAFMQGAYC